MKIRFTFWVQYLRIVSVFFALLGMVWVIVGSFDPFGLYDRAFAQAFWNTDTLPKDAGMAFKFILGPFGATAAGYFILQYFIATHAYAKRELWAYQAILSAFFFWFFTDTIFCLLKGAYFNIFFANVPALLAMLPVVFTHSYFKTREVNHVK